jgi:hypothetical protein
MAQQEMEIFSGFNSTNPDELLKGLMRMFSSISSATTDGTGKQSDMHHVGAILSTTEFVMATKPELRDRLKVITNTCLDKMHVEYRSYPNLNNWMLPVLVRYGRLKL